MKLRYIQAGGLGVCGLRIEPPHFHALFEYDVVFTLLHCIGVTRTTDKINKLPPPPPLLLLLPLNE
ncbi:unnamed protein product [Hymenolepis diminuta]|uniref:Uncharacterized protein n=1 Tax=Hymenolepis diminuta TaxID=6216 RepID=A0A564YA70_HYMDI|nr:unnamed protein product [Hymenolepis diminuta]